MQKPPDQISGKMTGVLCVYSCLFMQFALQVQPRNLMLFSCHLSNEAVQLYQFQRWYSHKSTTTAGAIETPSGKVPAMSVNSKTEEKQK